MEQQKRVLVTGASGFIGGHLIDWLKENVRGASLYAFARRRHRNHGNISHAPIDLTDGKAVREALHQIQPDVVYHLAGSSRVTSKTPMSEYFPKNFITTLTLGEALKNATRPVRLFFASTVHVYGNRSEIATETLSPAPVSLYGFTKYLAERTLEELSKQSPHVHVVVGRLSSCIGPGQPEGFAVPDLCRKVAECPDGKPLKVGPLKAWRHFTDVRDIVRLFPQLIELDLPSRYEVFNLASSDELQVGDVLNQFLKISGKTLLVQSDPSTHANQFERLKLDLSKLKKHVPHAQFRDLNASLREMYERLRN